MATTNNRIYYACQTVELNGPSGTDNTPENAAWDAIQGLQSVGINTNFNLEPIYQLGQLSLYDNYEEIPEVEISLNKVLDGYATIYSMAMGTGSLNSLANHRCGARLTLYPDTSTSATGNALTSVEMLPAYLSSVTYNFPTEGNFTEEVTLVSNDKKWVSVGSPSNRAPANTEPTGDAPTGFGIMRRGQLSLAGSLLPSGSGGIPDGMKYQSISISMNLGRESIYNLGQRTPFLRYVNFPVEITSEFEVIANTGDMLGVDQGSNACALSKALVNKPIKIATCDGMVIDLGTKNKVTSVNYQGGDTGGGNATITYSFQTFNDFTYTPPTGANYFAADGIVEEDASFPLS